MSQETFTALGVSAELITAQLPGDEVREVIARRRAVLTAEDIRLRAPLVHVFFEEGAMERLVAVSLMHWPIEWMYVFLFGTGVARSLQQPAKSALFPQLVPREHFTNAVTWGTSAYQFAAITGPAAGTRWVHGAREAVGMVGNCGGGLTPWGTFCTAEENFHECWGDPEMKDARPKFSQAVSRPNEHYGYICEIDPETGEFFKHTALGRFAHENVAFTLARDGRLDRWFAEDAAVEDDGIEAMAAQLIPHEGDFGALGIQRAGDDDARPQR